MVCRTYIWWIDNSNALPTLGASIADDYTDGARASSTSPLTAGSWTLINSPAPDFFFRVTVVSAGLTLVVNISGP